MMSTLKKSGQSLIEILVASAVGVVILGAIVGIIVSALQLQSVAGNIQVASTLAGELMENVRAWSKSEWAGSVNSIATSTNYHLSSSSPFTAILGQEMIAIATSTYVRYFSLADVYRNPTLDQGIDELGGGIFDPSTKRVTISYSGPRVSTRTIVFYITRNKNNVTIQSDWSGGPNEPGPIAIPSSRFETSTNIDYATRTGSILIDLP